MQEGRLQIKTPYKSLFLTGLSGTEGRDFVARLISRLCRSKKVNLWASLSQLK